MKETGSPLFAPKTIDPNQEDSITKHHCRSPAEQKKKNPHLSRRANSFSFSSPSSLTSSNSSTSSYSSTTSSPFRSSTSAVPFSWEQQPGIPKNLKSTHQPKNPNRPEPTLPLPPPLRSNSDPFVSISRKKRPELGFVRDPFAVALMECSKDQRAEEDNEFWKRPIKAATAATRRRTMTDRFGLIDLYLSCKTTCSVADSTVYTPRSVRSVAAPGNINRRH